MVQGSGLLVWSLSIQGASQALHTYRSLHSLLTARSVHGDECGNFDVTGQIEEEDHPDASKYEGAYARPSVCKAARDYVRDAWDLSDSSEEDAEDNVPARADLEHEAEDDGFQVSRQSFR